jgi:hypothetical protein
VTRVDICDYGGQDGCEDAVDRADAREVNQIELKIRVREATMVTDISWPLPQILKVTSISNIRY